MQLFQPCSSPEQSKAIADLSSDLGDGWGMTFCALSSDLGDGGGVTFFALSSGLSVGSGMTGVTFCAQPMTTQASATSAIESRNCTLFFHPHLQPPSLAVATTFRDPRHDSSMFPLWRRRCAPSNPYPTWTPRFRSGCDEPGSEDRHIGRGSGRLRQRRPAVQAPTVSTDRMHALLVTRSGRA